MNFKERFTRLKLKSFKKTKGGNFLLNIKQTGLIFFIFVGFYLLSIIFNGLDKGNLIHFTKLIICICGISFIILFSYGSNFIWEDCKHVQFHYGPFKKTIDYHLVEPVKISEGNFRQNLIEASKEIVKVSLKIDLEGNRQYKLDTPILCSKNSKGANGYGRTQLIKVLTSELEEAGFTYECKIKKYPAIMKLLTRIITTKKANSDHSACITWHKSPIVSENNEDNLETERTVINNHQL